jgi:DNA-damage-inducible protein D
MSFNIESFEDCAQQNGVRYWLAHDLMRELGYESWTSFQKVVMKAQASCARLEMDALCEFMAATYVDTADGTVKPTIRLTRFACLLVTMHADERKPQVAAAKVALAVLANQVIAARLSHNELGRIETRDDLKSAEIALSSAAQWAGVQSHEQALFKDAGIRGMYNRSLRELKQMRGLNDKDTPYDFMGLTELAGNLFRVTQTAEKLRSTPDIGLRNAQQTAKRVGQDVRKMMIQNSGIAPEVLPMEQNIKDVKRDLRYTAKEMKKLDTKKGSSKK